MEDYSKPVNKHITEEILNQMNNTFYIINQKDETIGFFCYIKFKNKKIPTIIINNYIKNEDIKYTIDILINNNIKKIEVYDIIYKNKEYNITIMLIKNNNTLKYIELDDKLYEDEYEMLNNKESIYILQYNDMKNILVSYGIINKINKNQIIYSGNINTNSKYSLIFNLNNNKLIGIHKNNFKYYNKGINFNSIIHKLIYEYKHNNYKKKENIINVTIKINKEDINKEIYFLDNYEYKDNNGKIHKDGNLKELNELNTELYINNLKYKYHKYFLPIKVGIYDIKLKFNVNIKDSSYMFAGCKNIIYINFNSFNTKNVINMKYMFYDCINLKKLNLFSFCTKNVINMEGIFGNCKSLKNLDLSSFNVKNISNMSYMLYNCINLEELNLFSLINSNVNNMSCMFFNCTNIKNLDLLSLDTKKSIDMSFMLYNCKNYKNLDLSLYKSKNINIDNIFKNNMTIIYEINKNKNKIQLFGENFVTNNKNNCYLLIEGKKYDLVSYYNLNKKEKEIFEIELIEINPITNMSFMFCNCSSLYSFLDISKWDTKNVTDMSWMFYNCGLIISLPDISKWDTDNVINMSYMFSNSKSLTSLPDISKWNTKNVINMSYMFSNSKSLTKLPDISKWDTRNVSDMSFLFSYCYLLTSLPDISKWDTKNVTDMSSMFYYCISLNSFPDIFKWNTKKVTTMNDMFTGCNEKIIPTNFIK